MWSRIATVVSIASVAEGLRTAKRSNGTVSSYTQCGKKGASTSIVNGENADECEWRWQIGLASGRNRLPFCGGMLIDSEWALTAAHCCDSPDFYVVAGDYKPKESSSNVQFIPAAQVIQHPGYNSRTMVWDFALVRLESPVELNGCVGTVCLPEEGADIEPGSECWISGWGTLRSGGRQPNILQEAKVSILDNAVCNAMYDGEISSQMICAQGKKGSAIVDACQGDSGGPLVCQSGSSWALYGATSWGYGCADKAYPGVWARVHEALGWIEQTMSGSGEAPAPNKCPAFARTPLPDQDGDCACPYGQYCSTSGSGGPSNCPTSQGAGGWGGGYFGVSCRNCACHK
jgi:secreted trypsin-like serine protease